MYSFAIISEYFFPHQTLSHQSKAEKVANDNQMKTFFHVLNERKKTVM